MDTKALRQKILDLAIRGKLVPQDPNDEPASVLLERIREQKMQMVKEGKLKAKDITNDTIIFVGEDNLHYEKFQDGTVKCIEDEIPFEVPEGWEWTRFSAITINRDNERKPISSSQRTDVAKIYDYYGASGKIDKIDKYIFSERLLLIGEDGANLVTRSKPIAFFAEGQYWVNNHAHCIDATDKFILEYLCFYINAISLGKYVTGSAQPKMTQDNFDTLWDLENVRYLCQRDYKIENERTNIKIGDILLTTVATLGRSCIYNGFPKNLCFQRSVTVISTDIVPEYLKLFLDAPYFQKFIFNNATGTAQKGFYLNQLENVLVCVPPLSEQTRMLQTADAVLKQLIRLEESLN